MPEHVHLDASPTEGMIFFCLLFHYTICWSSSGLSGAWHSNELPLLFDYDMSHSGSKQNITKFPIISPWLATLSHGGLLELQNQFIVFIAHFLFLKASPGTSRHVPTSTPDS